MNNIFPVFFENAVGILAAAVTLIVSEIILRWIFNPQKEFKELRRRTLYVLTYYADVIHNPRVNINQEVLKETEKEIRRLATDWKVFAEDYPKRKFDKICVNELIEISSSLIGLSNSLRSSECLKENRETTKNVLSTLKLK